MCSGNERLSEGGWRKGAEEGSEARETEQLFGRRVATSWAMASKWVLKGERSEPIGADHQPIFGFGLSSERS